MKEKILKRILDLNVEYLEEMRAEGAWMGHAYATAYLAGLRTRIIELAKEIQSLYKNREDIFREAGHIAFILEDDYDALITKVYQAKDFTHRDREIVAEALSSAFVNNLDRVFDDFRYIYEQLSGKRYNPALEAAMTA